MQRYWSSLRYSFLRTLFLLAAGLRRHLTADLGLAESKIDYANLRPSQPTAPTDLCLRRLECNVTLLP